MSFLPPCPSYLGNLYSQESEASICGRRDNGDNLDVGLGLG